MTDGIISIIKDNKFKFLIMLLLLIVIIIIFSLNSNLKKKVENKVFKNSDYVFTKLETNKELKCPYINIKSKTISNINGRIMQQYYKMVNEKNNMNYTYSINNNILSLLIIITKKEIGYTARSQEFITYNINLETSKVIKDRDLLSMYELSDDEVVDYVSGELKNSYEIEANEGYIVGEECDFNCYLNMHDIPSISANLVYYVDKNNKLIGYLNHELETIYFDKDDYKEFNYKYILN